MRNVTPLLLLLVALGTAGCASGGAGGSSGSPDLITREQITESSAQNAYDLVQQLRPRWLRGRGTGSIQNPGSDLPVIYLGEVRHGDIESLRGFSLGGLEELRFINASNATTRYGSGHAGGVIRVTLQRSSALDGMSGPAMAAN
ncbi:hypothetical protein BH23GEM11_BH23GEM11_14470 [soil metagenome]